MPLPKRQGIRSSRREEDNLQKAVVNHLLVRAYDEVIWWHTPNGEKRDKRTGAKLKAMGVKPGIPDLLFFHCARLFFIELKKTDGKGRLSKAQKERIAELEFQGAIGIVSSSLDEVLEFCEDNGLIRPSVMGEL